MVRPITIFAIFFILSGCATNRIGMTRAQLVEALGVPVRTVRVDNKVEAWEYEDSGITYTIQDGRVIDQKKHWHISLTTEDARNKK